MYNLNAPNYYPNDTNFPLQPFRGIWIAVFGEFGLYLRCDERQQSHVPGLLKRLGYHALVFGAGTGPVVAQNFCMRRHKTAQGLRIFIIYSVGLVGTKITLLFYLGLVVPVV